MSSQKLFFTPLKHSISKKRKLHNRGISEIIGAMILLGVTVSGGLLVWTLVQGNDVINFVESEQELNPNVITKIKLIGYDTRDALNLYQLPEIDNSQEPSSGVNKLCTDSCDAANSEFIVLKIRNDGSDDVRISSIVINEQEHNFDADNVNNGLTLDDDPVTDLPAGGEFIIVSGTGTIGVRQQAAEILPSSSEKRIIIRLNPLIHGTASATPSITDIALNSHLRVVINSSAESTQLLLVPVGEFA